MSGLPMYTHTHVLGVDIGVHQQATESTDYPGHVTRASAVDVLAYGSDRPHSRACRRYVAAWVRRGGIV